VIAMRTQLRRFREELNPRVTQEALAKAAGVTVQWYRQLENNGQATSYTTANAILQAINAERVSRNLEALKLDELELKIV
jgi:DNA-binding XRE family transcriptional regulator